MRAGGYEALERYWRRQDIADIQSNSGAPLCAPRACSWVGDVGNYMRLNAPYPYPAEADVSVVAMFCISTPLRRIFRIYS